MNTKFILAAFTLSTLISQLSTPLHAQGSLTPPAGPPVASMKTLDQVEARTPVNQTTCPGNATSVHVISSSGSYYLTGNVATETLANGLTISASNVTLDLNGFSLIRLTGTGGTAVFVGGFKSIRIRNGNIAGGTTQTGGVFSPAGWSTGLQSAPSSGNVCVSDLTVRGVQSTGIQTSASGVVERCQVDTCGGAGISSFFVTDCVVRNASGAGITVGDGEEASVKNCFAASVGNGDGIHAPGADVFNSKGIAVSGGGISAEKASDCSGSSVTNTGLTCRGDATNCSGSSATGPGLTCHGNATNCSGISSGIGGGLTCICNATNCTGRSESGVGLDCRGGNATNCSGSSSSGRGLFCNRNATNCDASGGNSPAMNVIGTASYCRGTHHAGGTAIGAAIAIGCTSGGGTIAATNKYLMP